MVLNQGQFFPQEKFDNTLKNVWLSQKEGATGILWVEAKVAANILQWTGWPLKTNNYLVQSVSSDKVEKSYSNHLGVFFSIIC